MVIKVGINGFGRIGRVVFRTCLEHPDVEVCAINDPAIEVNYICYLIKYDSTHGTLKNKVSHTEDEIIVDGLSVKVFKEKLPTNIPWQAAGTQYIIEASGMFTNLDKASGHLNHDSVKRVIVTAPCQDIPMVIFGVNENKVQPDQKVISCGSSTLYCLAPIIKVLEDSYGVEEGFITSIHAMTPSLKPLDGLCLKGKHWRDHRSITQNIIPAPTGACKALGRIIPALRDRMCGLAFRVPIANVSVLDLTVRLKKFTSLENIVSDIAKFNETTKNIMKINNDEAVSSDFIGDSYSCILDIKSCIQLKCNSFKLICWYENEYSYACRVIDLIIYSEKQLIELNKHKFQNIYRNVQNVHSQKATIPINSSEIDLKDTVTEEQTSSKILDVKPKILPKLNDTDTQQQASTNTDAKANVTSKLNNTFPQRQASSKTIVKLNVLSKLNDMVIQEQASSKADVKLNVLSKLNDIVTQRQASLKTNAKLNVMSKLNDKVTQAQASSKTDANPNVLSKSNDTVTQAQARAKTLDVKRNLSSTVSTEKRVMLGKICKDNAWLQPTFFHKNTCFASQTQRGAFSINAHEQLEPFKEKAVCTNASLKKVKQEVSKMVKITDILLKESYGSKDIPNTSEIAKNINKRDCKDITNIASVDGTPTGTENSSSIGDIRGYNKIISNSTLNSVNIGDSNIEQVENMIWEKINKSDYSMTTTESLPETESINTKRKEKKLLVSHVTNGFAAKIKMFDGSLNNDNVKHRQMTKLIEKKDEFEILNEANEPIGKAKTQHINLQQTITNNEKLTILTDSQNSQIEAKQKQPVDTNMKDIKNGDRLDIKNDQLYIKDNQLELPVDRMDVASTQSCDGSKHVDGKIKEDAYSEGAISVSVDAAWTSSPYYCRKKDIYDKLDSSSGSNISFETEKKTSDIINITDLTNSLEDLDRLDKMCRIIEISDELSDELFAALDKSTEKNNVKLTNKWSFKELCAKINLDEFCDKVFGK